MSIHLADWLEREVKNRKGPPALPLAIALRQDQWTDIIAALRAPRPEEATTKDAERYRFLQRTSCGNTAGGKGSDEECYLSLNPRDMDMAIDAGIASQRPPQEQR